MHGVPIRHNTQAAAPKTTSSLAPEEFMPPLPAYAKLNVGEIADGEHICLRRQVAAGEERSPKGRRTAAYGNTDAAGNLDPSNAQRLGADAMPSRSNAGPISTPLRARMLRFGQHVEQPNSPG